MVAPNTLPMLVSSTGRTYRLLAGNETLIGSTGCAIMLTEPGVQPRHARILFDQGIHYIEDLGGGVLLNGQRIVARTTLHDNDILSVASAQLVFRAGTAPAMASSGSPHSAGTPPQPTPRPLTVQPSLTQVAPTANQFTPLPRTPITPPTPIQQPTPIQPPIPRTPPTRIQQPPPAQPPIRRAPIQQPPPAQPLYPPLVVPPAQQLVAKTGAPQQPTIIALPAQVSMYGQPHLQGKVAHVDGPHMEEPDYNLILMLFKALLWIFLFPILIWKPSLVSLITMGRKDNKVPTRYVRVQDSTGQETVVRMKGDIQRGAISMGDVVSFWGRWDSGTLQMQFAFNHQLNAEIRIR